MPPDVRFAVLEPTDCDGCGLCCRGIGSPPAQVAQEVLARIAFRVLESFCFARSICLPS